MDEKLKKNLNPIFDKNSGSFLQWAISYLLNAYMKSFQTFLQFLQQINAQMIHLVCCTGFKLTTYSWH